MILPKDDHLGDIADATSIYFYLFLLFFLRTKIIKVTVNSVLNRNNVSLTKLMNIAQSVTAMDLFKM